MLIRTLRLEVYCKNKVISKKVNETRNARTLVRIGEQTRSLALVGKSVTARLTCPLMCFHLHFIFHMLSVKFITIFTDAWEEV